MEQKIAVHQKTDPFGEEASSTTAWSTTTWTATTTTTTTAATTTAATSLKKLCWKKLLFIPSLFIPPKIVSLSPTELFFLPSYPIRNFLYWETIFSWKHFFIILPEIERTVTIRRNKALQSVPRNETHERGKEFAIAILPTCIWHEFICSGMSFAVTYK